MNTSLPVAIHPAGEPRILRAFGDEVHVYLSGAETEGQFAVGLVITPPGGGPPPHYHEQEHEWFHVLQGKVSFLADGAWTEVGPGARVSCPKNSVHTFKNTGDSPLHMIVTAAPAGFEEFFRRCAEEFAKPGAPNMPRLIEIAGEHGIHFVNP